MIIGSDVRGVVTRVEVERALRMGTPPEMEKPIVFRADQSLQEIESLMIQSNTGLFLVAETEGGLVTRVFTLHDLLRAQAALLE